MTTVNTYLIASLRDAFECGAAAGRHDSTPGNLFRSARPAAEEFLYDEGTPEYSAFVEGYVLALPRAGVSTDEHGIIVAEES